MRETESLRRSPEIFYSTSEFIVHSLFMRLIVPRKSGKSLSTKTLTREEKDRLTRVAAQLREVPSGSQQQSRSATPVPESIDGFWGEASDNNGTYLFMTIGHKLANKCNRYCTPLADEPSRLGHSVSLQPLRHLRPFSIPIRFPPIVTKDRAGKGMGPTRRAGRRRAGSVCV